MPPWMNKGLEMGFNEWSGVATTLGAGGRSSGLGEEKKAVNLHYLWRAVENHGRLQGQIYF